jgi:hypothetical protein
MFSKDTSLSIQNFEKLIREKRIYVDKTSPIHALIDSGFEACFFSRPRRFGKSLTLTTIEAIFQGKKELFTGLAIAKTNYAWPVHPVIRLDMKYAAQVTCEAAERGLHGLLDSVATQYGCVGHSQNIDDKFRQLIHDIHVQTQRGVVVLIDEYDKPLIDNLDNIAEAQKIQGLLKRFYGVLKSASEDLRFVFITGVSKFSKVSVFSDLNHLTDLTMDPRCAELVGMTEPELLSYYSAHIDAIATAKGWSRERVLDNIRQWYNGYRFSKQNTRVYNPWSTLSLFSTGDFQEHWYTTGIPKFLIDAINRDKEAFGVVNPADFDLTQTYTAGQFEAYDISTLQLIPLLFQTGFLTIKNYFEVSNIPLYQLGYPNTEVRNAFVQMVLDVRLTTDAGGRVMLTYHMQTALQSQQFETLVSHLNALIAAIPGNLHTPRESYYHSLIHMVFQMSGLHIRSEEWVSGGRMDTVIEEPDYIYIFEFKFGASADDAVAQIQQRGYANKFRYTGKSVVAIGISVNCEKKSIHEWRRVVLLDAQLSR